MTTREFNSISKVHMINYNSNKEKAQFANNSTLLNPEYPALVSKVQPVITLWMCVSEPYPCQSIIPVRAVILKEFLIFWTRLCQLFRSILKTSFHQFHLDELWQSHCSRSESLSNNRKHCHLLLFRWMNCNWAEPKKERRTTHLNSKVLCSDHEWGRRAGYCVSIQK